VLDRVGQEVAQRLRQAVRVDDQPPGRHLAELEAATREQTHPVPQVVDEHRDVNRLDLQELRLLRLRQHQQIVDQPPDPCDLCLHQPVHPADLLGGGVGIGREHFKLPAYHRQRRAELMRRIGHERALAGKCIRQTIEHAVEGMGQNAHLTAHAGIADAGMQIARIDPRGDRRKQPQRSRYARADQGCPEERSASARIPARKKARATPRWACVTGASGSPTPTVTLRPPVSEIVRFSRRRFPTSASTTVE